MSPLYSFIRLLLAAYLISSHVYFNSYFSSSLSFPQFILPSILFLLAFSLSLNAKVCSNLPSVAINVLLIEHDSCFVFTATILPIIRKNTIACVARIVTTLESKTIFQEISFLYFVSNIHILGSTTSIKAAYMYLKDYQC